MSDETVKAVVLARVVGMPDGNLAIQINDSIKDPESFCMNIARTAIEVAMKQHAAAKRIVRVQ